MERVAAGTAAAETSEDRSEMRVEQLAARAGVSVDTIRYYQGKGLLDPPRREGRLAWYGPAHLERLRRVRTLQQRGFTLATISRLLSGELDAADEALLGELSGWRRVTDAGASGAAGAEGGNRAGRAAGSHHPDGGAPGPTFTLDELAAATGVPLALLKAVEDEGLLIPRRFGGEDRYTDADVDAARAGLLLLEWGVPLSALLEVARRHHEATEAVAREAVVLFSTHVRGRLRATAPSPPAGSAADHRGGGTADDEPHVDRLLQAYAELLPAVNALVGHHFSRTLVKVALEHVDQVGSEAERRAIVVRGGVDLPGSTAGGGPSPATRAADGRR